MTRKILLLVAAMLFADAALAEPPAKPAGPPAGASSPPQDLPEGPGKAVVLTACTQCHGVDVITSQSLSRQEWADSVSRMIGNGAQLSDDEYSLVIDYLAKHFGPSTPGASADGGQGK